MKKLLLISVLLLTACTPLPYLTNDNLDIAESKCTLSGGGLAKVTYDRWASNSVVAVCKDGSVVTFQPIGNRE